MLQWLKNRFRPAPDPVEAQLLELFDFLLREHGFGYSKAELGNAVDENGKFIFYGPLTAYQFYSERVCMTVTHLVQRDDFCVYITERKSTDQVYLQKGTVVPSRLAYSFPALAAEVRDSVTECGTLFGHPI